MNFNTLFYLPNIDNEGPRAIRIRNIVEVLNFENRNCSKILKYNFINKCHKEDIILNSSWLYNIFLKFKLFHILLFFHPKFKLIGVDAIFTKINKSHVLKLLDRYEIKNLIIVVSPFTSLLLIPHLKRKKPFLRIILDIGDPLYKNSARWNNDNKSFMIEKTAVENVDKLIVTNELTKQFYINEFNIPDSKIHIIPQGVNIDLISRKNIIYDSDRKDKLKIVYGGRFYDGLRSPKNIFMFLNNNNKFILDVYGNNKKENVNNVYFNGKVKQQELFIAMNQADLLLFIDNSQGIQTSGKIYELLAFKKPIIFLYNSINSPLYSVVKDYKNVFLIENNYYKIKKTLDNLEINDLAKVSYSIDKFSWQARADKYKSVLNYN